MARSLSTISSNNRFSSYPSTTSTSYAINNSELSNRISSVAPSRSFQLNMSTVAAGATTARRVKTAEAEVSEEQVSIKGWVRTVRKQKTLAFVEVNDGSNMSGIQCVLPFDTVDEDTMKGEYFMCIIYTSVAFTVKLNQQQINASHIIVITSINQMQRLITSQLDAPSMQLVRSSNLKVASKPSNFPPPRFALLVNAPEIHSH